MEDNFLDKPILKDKELNTKTVILDLDDSSDNESLNDNQEEKDLPIVIKMAEDIDNIDLFLKHMTNNGYKLSANRFLHKNFAESINVKQIYHINITINNEQITAIIAYDNKHKIVQIPKAILQTVQEDINNALVKYI